MTTYRGQDGFLSMGGKLNASAGPLVNGALTIGLTTLNLDGTGLTGVVAVGDKFTIPSESGTPVHTVTGGPFYVAAANAITGLTFTPGIATGGVADNAPITFAVNSVLEMTAHSFDSSLDTIEDSSMGDAWKTFAAGLAQWKGTGEAWLDYGDLKQKALIDTLLVGTPVQPLPCVMFGFGATKQMYAGAILSGVQIAATLGEMVKVTFSFTGSGAMLPNWT